MATNFNTVVSSSASNSQITTQGNDALITKAYADANYSGGGSSGTAYFLQLTGANGSTHTITQSATTIPFDTSRVISNASHFTISSGEITVANAGNYFINYSIDSDQTGGNRVTVTGFIEVSTNSGSSFSEVRGTRGHDYSRNNTQEESTSQGSSVIALSAGDILRVRVLRDSTVAASANTELSHFSILSINASVGASGVSSGTDNTANVSTIDLTKVAGTYYTSISNTASYTVASGAVAGGFAHITINKSGTEPTFTNAAKLAGATFSASTDMKMVVYNDGVENLFYFLSE